MEMVAKRNNYVIYSCTRTVRLHKAWIQESHWFPFPFIYVRMSRGVPCKCTSFFLFLYLLFCLSPPAQEHGLLPEFAGPYEGHSLCHVLRHTEEHLWLSSEGQWRKREREKFHNEMKLESFVLTYTCRWYRVKNFAARFVGLIVLLVMCYC